MSEFVECQNCGRKFFAENIDCPYCGDGIALDDLIREVQGSPPTSRMYHVMLLSFELSLVGIILFAFWGWSRAVTGHMRIFLAAEAIYAGTVLLGIAKNQEWGRSHAIGFILSNAAIGILSIIVRDRFFFLVWGPGPLVLLVFLVPFVGHYARYGR